ncbi:MAG: prephenate dehydratase, partial [Bacteriovoracaceae bacterium]
HEAAICSSLCEKYYDLKLLAQNIQNVKDNFTRFFSFGLKENNPEIEAKDHTTLAFMTKHHPGALVNCLTEFSKNFINLTKIESRPIPHNPFEYIFYVDFRGSIDMPETQVVLKELEKDTKEIKIIGSYKRIRKG